MKKLETFLKEVEKVQKEKIKNLKKVKKEEIKEIYEILENKKIIKYVLGEKGKLNKEEIKDLEKIKKLKRKIGARLLTLLVEDYKRNKGRGFELWKKWLIDSCSAKLKGFKSLIKEIEKGNKDKISHFCEIYLSY